MSLKDRINEDIKTAMKAKDQAALRALRAIKSAILLAETAEGRTHGTELSEDEGLQLLSKQLKQRKDSIAQFIQNNRPDLAQTEQEEVEVISRYLPQALSPEDLQAAIKTLIAELGATGAQDFGRVMKEASTRLRGQAEGKDISAAVKSLLG
ncbi:MAG: GatB/YqeY domain-containing protein [Bacteroidetes bacterium]|nr:GatB/YqeY domain-containing protein [Bacteroidota bacterium]